MSTILFLAADPTDATRLRLGEESREIREKLQLSKYRDSIFFHQRFSVRPEDLTQALLDVTPQIVHFSGHGHSDGSLCFEDKLGKVHSIRPDALAALFEQFANQIRCVTLSACFSEVQAKAISRYIDYVVGMNQAIGDKAAIAFAVGFYQSIGAERTIEEAYRLGCVQMRLQGFSEHSVPVLITKKPSVIKDSVPEQRAKSEFKSYEAEITRSNPALFVFLIDQSGSMADVFNDYAESRAVAIANVVNKMVYELVLRSSQGEYVPDYFHVAVLGYGAQPGEVMSAFSGILTGRDIVRISELADSPARIESRVINQADGQGNIIPVEMKFPIWIEPAAGADAPMCKALRKAYQIVSNWIDSGHQYAFPPVVINLTDGAATDGEPLRPAKNLMQLKTNSGNVLLFNCCLSYMRGTPILYPENAESIQDEYGKMLFEMSSPLTPRMCDFARALGYSIGSQSRGFTYQAELVDVVKFLDIGTRPGYLR